MYPVILRTGDRVTLEDAHGAFIAGIVTRRCGTLESLIPIRIDGGGEEALHGWDLTLLECNGFPVD
jgi:hypothetical protein